MDIGTALAALIGSIAGTGVSWAIVAFFVKRWMDSVDAAIAKLTEAHPTYRTKDEAAADWTSARCALADHDRRITRLETVCERELSR